MTIRQRWFFRVRRCQSGLGGWIALAKREPFVTPDGDPIREPGELWFQFGATQEDAMKRIEDEVKNMKN